jgi:hypothetical protein
MSRFREVPPVSSAQLGVPWKDGRKIHVPPIASDGTFVHFRLKNSFANPLERMRVVGVVTIRF